MFFPYETMAKRTPEKQRLTQQQPQQITQLLHSHTKFN